MWDDIPCPRWLCDPTTGVPIPDYPCDIAVRVRVSANPVDALNLALKSDRCAPQDMRLAGLDLNVHLASTPDGYRAVLPATAHVATGALILATSWFLTLRAHLHLAPADG